MTVLTKDQIDESNTQYAQGGIAGVLAFGDREDPNSNVSQLLAENQFFRMHEELGTDPGMYYIFDKK